MADDSDTGTDSAVGDGGEGDGDRGVGGVGGVSGIVGKSDGH